MTTRYLRRFLVLSLICVLMLAMGCTTSTDTDVTVEESFITVVAKPVTEELVLDTHTLFSSIKGVDELAIISTLSGEVAKVNVDNGATIIKGAQLFTLKSTVIDKQIAQAKKSLELAKQSFDSASKRYQEAQITLKRNADLLAQGSISQSTFEQIEQQSTPAQQDAARIQYEQAQLQLKQLQQSLSDLVYKAKGDGTLNQWTLKVGDLVQPGAMLGKLINTSSYKVELNVAERLLTRLTLETPVKIVIPSTSQTHMGKIVEIGTTAQSAGKLYPVKITFSSADNTALRSGLFCEVDFELGSANPQIAIPSTAILSDPTGNYVYTVDISTENASPTKTPVTVGFDNGHLIIISSGLSISDWIVVKGQQYINADREVRVIKGE